MIVLALGLVNWLVTLVIVESELFRPLREWVAERATRADESRMRYPRNRSYVVRSPSLRYFLWDKARYLVACHLCTGIWVGFGLAVFAPNVFGGVIGFVLTGLLIKAIGHVTLEAIAAVQRSNA